MFKKNLIGVFLAASLTGASAWAQERHAEAAPARAPGPTALPVLPSLPGGVIELKFSDFFEMPVGRYGLKPTSKLLGLDGKRVRMLGYMVHQETPSPGFFIFSPVPINIAEEADGMADDLPPSIVFVHMPQDRDKVVPYTPGLLLLTGTLSLGAKDEADQRVSHVRLMLDLPSAAASSFQSPADLPLSAGCCKSANPSVGKPK